MSLSLGGDPDEGVVGGADVLLLEEAHLALLADVGVAGLGVDAAVVADVLEGEVHGAAHAAVVVVVAVHQLLLAQGGLWTRQFKLDS